MKFYENEFTTKNMTQACHEGFTLAETLITVAILGVVAAITIPAIINHQTESANRTKLKKAMTTYEKALNQMIIENDLKTNDAITAFGADGENCANTTEYFKKVEGSGCRFKTADRIWWDITDIENPVISLKDEITEDNAATMKTNAESLDSDRTSFAMIGRLDDTTGTFRINDNGFEQANGSDEQKKYMTKLYNFMNKVENAAADGGGDDNGADDESGADEDYCGAYCQASKMSACTGENKNCYKIYGSSIYYYDENGNQIMGKNGCTSGTGENCESIYFSTSTSLKGGYTATVGPPNFYGCKGDINTCTSFQGTIYDEEGNLFISNCGLTYSDLGCYDRDHGQVEIPCPVAKDELIALFQ